MSGPAEIQARIAEIQFRFRPQSVSSSSPAPAASAAASATSFADVLAQAQGTTSSTSVGDGAIAALSKFGNGKVPASQLEPLGIGDHRLWGPAADAFKKMRSDASAVGIKIGVNDSYRSYDEQVQMAKTKGLYSQGGLAATPGKSDHGWGISVDLELNAQAQSWMRTNASKYGFTENVAKEPWHWTFTSGR